MNNWLARESVLSVKAEHIATFLGHKIVHSAWRRSSAPGSPRGSKGPALSIALAMPRSRCATNSSGVAYRDDDQRRVLFQAPPKGGTSARASDTRLRPGQKVDLQPDRSARRSCSCNRRYLLHLSTLSDFSAGVRALDRLTRPRKINDKTVKGINFFDPNRQRTCSTRYRTHEGEYSRGSARRSAAAAGSSFSRIACRGNCVGCVTSA